MRSTSASIPCRLRVCAAFLAGSVVFLLLAPTTVTASQKHRAAAGVAAARVALRKPHRAHLRAPHATPAPPAPPELQPVPPTFYGLNAQTLFGLPESQWDEELDKLAATGVGTVRFDTWWNAIEPKPPLEGIHGFNWATLDAVVAALARHGLRGLPIVDYSARWAAPKPAPELLGDTPPDPAAFAAFAQALVGRYGPGGTFWAENPTLPTLPIEQYEIWNEENTTEYFEGADPQLYASLYIAARDAIHAVDPAATVIVGGLLSTTFVNPIPWLEGFLASLPTHGQEIDAIGWHPYFWLPSEALSSLRALHETLASQGVDPPVDLTEVNTPGDPAGSSFAWSSPLLGELARVLPRSDCHIVGMIVHTWSPWPAPRPPDPYAIADSAGNLNPAGLVYSSAIRAAETQGVGVPAPICGAAPVAQVPATRKKAKRFRRHKRLRRGATLSAKRAKPYSRHQHT